MKPNYPLWDTFDAFTDEQTAWLWADEEPQLGMQNRTGAVLAMLNRIDDAIKRGEITRGVRDTRGPVTYYSERTWDSFIGGAHEVVDYFAGELSISRESLKQWANSMGAKPPFLFDEARTQSSTKKAVSVDASEEQDPITGKKIDNLRKTLALAAIALVSEQKGAKHGAIEGPNVDSLATLINQQVGVLQAKGFDFKTYGLSKETIAKEITAGLQLLEVKK